MSKAPQIISLPPKFLSPRHSPGSSSVPSLISYCPTPSQRSGGSLSGLSAYVEEAIEASIEEDDTMREDLSGIDQAFVEESSESYQHFSSELRTAKAELVQLCRENKQLHLQIESQEQQIRALHVLYKHQAQSLHKELADLRTAATRAKLSTLDEDWQTKPTIETEEFTGLGEGRGTCCVLS